MKGFVRFDRTTHSQCTCRRVRTTTVQTLKTHWSDDDTAAEGADVVTEMSGVRREQLRCATRELLRLTRQRDNVRTLFLHLRSVGSKRTTALK